MKQGQDGDMDVGQQRHGHTSGQHPLQKLR